MKELRIRLPDEEYEQLVIFKGKNKSWRTLLKETLKQNIEVIEDVPEFQPTNNPERTQKNGLMSTVENIIEHVEHPTKLIPEAIKFVGGKKHTEPKEEDHQWKCPKCGHHWDGNKDECPDCGAKLEEP